MRPVSRDAIDLGERMIVVQAVLEQRAGQFKLWPLGMGQWRADIAFNDRPPLDPNPPCGVGSSPAEAVANLLQEVER